MPVTAGSRLALFDSSGLLSDLLRLIVRGCYLLKSTYHFTVVREE